jgi:hypothetical protein
MRPTVPKPGRVWRKTRQIHEHRSAKSQCIIVVLELRSSPNLTEFDCATKAGRRPPQLDNGGPQAIAGPQFRPSGGHSRKKGLSALHRCDGKTMIVVMSGLVNTPLFNGLVLLENYRKMSALNVPIQPVWFRCSSRVSSKSSW